jgi:hypothetical protein
MKPLFAVLFLLALSSAGVASDETLTRGICGTYARSSGMEATVVDLQRDGVYVLTVQSCLASEEEGRGRWSIRDGFLLLDRRGDPKEKRGRLSRFQIVVVDGDIALKPQDDHTAENDREAESQLFLHRNEPANQSSQRNAIVRPSSDFESRSSRG